MTSAAMPGISLLLFQRDLNHQTSHDGTQFEVMLLCGLIGHGLINRQWIFVPVLEARSLASARSLSDIALGL
jgi:hypothetical protein